MAKIMHLALIKQGAATTLLMLITASALSTMVYSTGIDPIPTSNTIPTNPLEKFQYSYPSMYMAEKTELCHGTQVKKGLFTNTSYDMYVIRTGVLEKATNGLIYKHEIYSQFNDNSISTTFSWNIETGAGMDRNERVIKAMYEGICAQNSVVIRTKVEQLAINERDPTRKPVEPGPCQDETRLVAGIDSKIAIEEVEAYLDPSKRETIGATKLDRIKDATINATVQGKHNVTMQSLLIEKAVAVAALAQCKNPIKTKTETADPLDQLRTLKSLLDDKIITQKEFETKKASLLK